uniref:Uncharacterized protein n=2 Tax=Photinus pyralis TaxID=7054 RepID=A0A1Y1NBN1_PHOPY
MFHKCSMATSNDRTQYYYRRENLRKDIERELSLWNVKKYASGATYPGVGSRKMGLSPSLRDKDQTIARSQLYPEGFIGGPSGNESDPGNMLHTGTGLVMQHTPLPDTACLVTANEFRAHDPQLDCLFNNDQVSTQPMNSMHIPLERFFDSARRNPYLVNVGVIVC